MKDWKRREVADKLDSMMMRTFNQNLQQQNQQVQALDFPCPIPSVK